MAATMKKVGTVPHHELFAAGEADQFLVVVPEPGFKDEPEASRVTLAALRDYAQKLGRKCGLVIIANNLLAQEPESRRIYAEGVTPDLFIGITMVVSSPVARVIGNLALHLQTLQVPINVVHDVDAGIAWLKSVEAGA